MKKLIYIFPIILFLTLGTSAYAAHVDRSFSADLTGEEEVPSVETDAVGRLTLNVNSDETEAKFRLSAFDASAVTMAHLHCAPKGQNGPPFAFLFGEVPGGFDVNGRLAAFTLKNANITSQGLSCSPTPIKTVADMAKAIREGNVYANIHTMAHPNGEMRGQIE